MLGFCQEKACRALCTGGLRSKAIRKKHSHLKGHQPHCILVSVYKMHSFSFAWVPLSRSLVGKTRKDSSQTTLVLALAIHSTQMVGGSFPNSPGDWCSVCRNPSFPVIMGTCSRLLKRQHQFRITFMKTLDHKINKSPHRLLPSSFMCKV